MIRFPEFRAHLADLSDSEQIHYDAGFHAPLEEYVDQARRALARG